MTLLGDRLRLVFSILLTLTTAALAYLLTASATATVPDPRLPLNLPPLFTSALFTLVVLILHEFSPVPTLSKNTIHQSFLYLLLPVSIYLFYLTLTLKPTLQIISQVITSNNTNATTSTSDEADFQFEKYPLRPERPTDNCSW